MTIYVEKPAFNLRSKLNELDYQKVPYEKMPSGTIINTAYSEYSTQVHITTTGRRKYATIWTPYINARESGSDFLVITDVQGYVSLSVDGVNTGIQRCIDDAWITLADEVKNADAANGDNWMGMNHNSGLASYSFSRTRFAMDTYRNYKAGEKVMYDICAGYHNSSAGDMKINYSGYNSQCTAFIMEIKQ